MSCKNEETRSGEKMPNGEMKSPAEKREELLNEFRKLGDYDPDLPADSALTEIEAVMPPLKNGRHYSFLFYRCNIRPHFKLVYALRQLFAQTVSRDMILLSINNKKIEKYRYLSLKKKLFALL